MKGKIMEINTTDVLVAFDNGIHVELPLSHFHNNCKSGDCVNIHKLDFEKKINQKHTNTIF